jgi:hypothetical protein
VSTVIEDPINPGPPTITFDVDQVRLKRNLKNVVLVSVRGFDPHVPFAAYVPQSWSALDLSKLSWVMPAPDWAIDGGKRGRAGKRASEVRSWSRTAAITPGSAPDRGELLVKGPDGARGAVGFTVVPEQAASANAASVKVDGALSEWSVDEFTLAKGPLGEARTAVRWSPEGLAFAVDVLDEQHFQQESTAILWRGDSVQFAVSAKPNTTLGYQGKDLEFGAALTPAGPLVWCWYGGDGGKTGRVDSASVAVKREGAHTLYEVFLPAAVLRGLDLRAGNVLGFGYIANDNDGAGYRGATEWTPGMTGTKDSSLFGDLLLR